MKQFPPQLSAAQHVAWGAAGAILASLMSFPGHSTDLPTATLTVVYVSAGVVFLLGMRGLRHTVSTTPLLAWIVFVGLVMRVFCLSEPPRYETDYYRYLWDGAVTAHGWNPYAVSPQDVLNGVPELNGLASEGAHVLRRINHPGVTTIYPPVAQALFAAAYYIAPVDATALRALFLAVDIAIALMVLQLLRVIGRPLHWMAIYWWNPIVVGEFFISAHMDGLATALVLASVLATIGRWRRMGVLLLALAIGTKVWPVVLAPILLRHAAPSRRERFAGTLLLTLVAGVILLPLAVSWQAGTISGVRSYSYYWINNAGFFSLIRSAGESLGVGDPDGAARLISIGTLLAWILTVARSPNMSPIELIQASLMSLAGLFLLSPTQFPWYYTWLLPLLALIPWPPLLLYTALLPLYHMHYEHPWLLWVEHLPVWAMMAWMVCRGRRPIALQPLFADTTFMPPAGVRIGVVIPALNEEKAIGHVLTAIPAWVTQVVVVDNGSTDRTAEAARSHGVEVVHLSQRGYGAACQAGIAALDRPDIVVFLDADFSDHPEEMDRLVAPILADEADLVIGSRVLGRAEPGALSPQQRFGNALACQLIRLLFRTRFTDLGPFRAIRGGTLKRLRMTDRTYGWTVQMQVRASRHGVRTVEVPASYRRRIGRSKISGTIRGIVGAGTKIIGTILREALEPRTRTRDRSVERLIILARYPEAGKAKTRLIPLLGAAGAARLHRQLVTITLQSATDLMNRRGIDVEVRSTDASPDAMRAMFDAEFTYTDQGEGDLGKRLQEAATAAMAEGVARWVMIGTDCPTLTAADLDEAFHALVSHDIVLGPALDGGYYLIGMKQAHAGIFHDIPWGGSDVLKSTVQAAARLGLAVHMLAPRSDVDTPEDLSVWAQSIRIGPDEPPRLSIIIPARNEQDHLPATLAAALRPGVELIVVDAQSTDRTVDIARHFGATVISTPPSRGVQLNAGAVQARADTLLFLHADTLLPPGYEAVVTRLLDQPETSAGAFTLGIDAKGIPIRMVEFGVRIRSTVLGRPYGDQAIFMKRKTFDACGGFPHLPYMEDYVMLRRLWKLGRVCIAPQRVRTAARSWQRHGVVNTTVYHQWIILKYSLGLGPREQLESHQSCGSPPQNERSGTLPSCITDALRT